MSKKCKSGEKPSNKEKQFSCKKCGQGSNKENRLCKAVKTKP